MLYQLSYASPDSLILPFSKTPKHRVKEGVQIERLTHAETLCNASRTEYRGKKECLPLMEKREAFQEKTSRFQAFFLEFIAQAELHLTL